MANVFISHSSKDHEVAEKLCAMLEANGISCWMAPRDIHPGEEWAKAINDAITASDVFIVIYSAASSASNQVPKEIGLAGARNRYIVPYKIDGTPLTGEFEYHLLNSHWVVADIAKNDYKINELCETIRNVVNKNGHNASGGGNVNITNNIGQVNVTGVQNNGTVNIPAIISKNKVPVLAVAAAVIIILVFSSINKAISKGLTSSADISSGEQAAEEVLPDKDSTVGQEQKMTEETVQDAVVNADFVQVPVDFEPYDYKGKIYKNDKEKSFVMAGQTFNTGIVLDSQKNGYLLLNNTGKYSKLKFTAGHIDGYYSDNKKISVKLDGEEAEVLSISPYELPKEYEFDISGISGIEIAADKSVYQSLIGVTEIYMYNDISPARDKGTAELDTAIVPVDVCPYECNGKIYINDKEKCFSVAGQNYNTGIVINKKNSGYFLINNTDLEYTKMKFTLGRIDGYSDEKLKLRVYLDNEEKEIIDIPARSVPAEYEIDITASKGIFFQLDEGIYDGKIGLTDIILSK